MQQGIGRAGVILLALVTFAIGAFGLTLAWTAFGAGASTFFVMGVGVAAVALLGLFLFTTFTSSGTEQSVAPAAAPAAKSAPVPVPAQPEMNFEFNDYEPAAHSAPEELHLPEAFQEAPPTPMPEAAPEAPVMFKAAAAKQDPAAWPGARGKSTWTQQVEHKQHVAAQVDESRQRQQLAEKYTRTTPTLRAILDDGVPAPQPQTVQVPERIADRVPRDMNTDFVAPGMSIGQCGQCRTQLLAPEERPLRLKCPECAKVTLLQ